MVNEREFTTRVGWVIYLCIFSICTFYVHKSIAYVHKMCICYNFRVMWNSCIIWHEIASLGQPLMTKCVTFTSCTGQKRGFWVEVGVAALVLPLSTGTKLTPNTRNILIFNSTIYHPTPKQTNKFNDCFALAACFLYVRCKLWKWCFLIWITWWYIIWLWLQNPNILHM